MSTAISIEKIRSAIVHLDVTDRKAAVAAASAIKFSLGEVGFDVWHNDLGMRVFTDHDGDARLVWEHTGADGGAGIDALFSKAAANGWTWEQNRPRSEIAADFDLKTHVKNAAQPYVEPVEELVKFVVLHKHGEHVGKRLRFESGHIEKVSSYPRIAYWSRFEQIDIKPDVDALHDVLSTLPMSAAITLSAPVSNEVLKKNNLRRISKPHKDGSAPTLKSDPSRIWVLDIDGMPLADAFDPERPQDACDEIRSKLNLSDYSCVWQISSSQRPYSDLFNGRLWFILDASLPLKVLSAAATVVGADGGVFDPADVIYTANPIFESNNDPISERWGVLYAEECFLPVGSVTELADQNNSVIGGSYAGNSHTIKRFGIDNILGYLGDGPGLNGFHEVLRAFSCRAAKSGVDSETFKARCREAMVVAPKKPGRPASDMERYLSDDYLDDLLESAAHFVRKPVQSVGAQGAVQGEGDAGAAGKYIVTNPILVDTSMLMMSCEDAIAAIDAAKTNEEIRSLAEKLREQQFSVGDFAIVVEQYRNAFSLLTGVSLTKPEARKALKPTKARATKTFVSDRPKWLDGWVYLTKWEEFYHVETGRSMSRVAFDAAHTRFVTPNDEGTQPAASNEALHYYQIEAAERTMYMPHLGESFSFEGLPMINSFLPDRIPQAAEKIDEDGMAAVELIRSHIRNILGNRDDQAQLFIDWLAFQVQNIGKKVRFAPIIKGIEGDGKSLLTNVLAAAIGSANITPVNPGELTETKFNGYAEGSAVVVLEEVRVCGHNRYDILNAVKQFITNDTARIVKKGRDGYKIWNVTNYIAFTNYADALPIDDGDRRWWILFTPWSNREEMAQMVGESLPEYFSNLHSAINNNGPAIRRWLLDWKISKAFNPDGAAPITDERDVMIGSGRSEDDDLIRELVEQGGLGFSKDVVFIPYLLAEYNRYQLANNQIRGQSLTTPLRKLGFTKWKRFRWNDESQNVWLRNPVGASDLAVKKMLDDTKPEPHSAEQRQLVDSEGGPI